MNIKLTRSVIYFILILINSVINANAQQPSTNEPITSHESELLAKAVNTSIFVYTPEVDPCAPLPPDQTLVPLGSAFVVGIKNNKTSTPEQWQGYKFLITAKHVLANHTNIMIRLNLAHEIKFKCQSISLTGSGANPNMFMGGSGVDLAAVSLPDILDTDPTVLDADLLLDGNTMKKWNIGVGTQILTVGYIFGYSGQKSNYPVTKFGNMSVITEEHWYYNAQSKLSEQGYVIQLPNAPGLSGAPVLTHGIEFDTNPFRFRQLSPYLVGVIKALLLAPANNSWISQDLAVIEPAANLKVLISEIASKLKAAGNDVDVK
jgi:hypothetical protein